MSRGIVTATSVHLHNLQLGGLLLVLGLKTNRPTTRHSPRLKSQCGAGWARLTMNRHAARSRRFDPSNMLCVIIATSWMPDEKRHHSSLQ